MLYRLLWHFNKMINQFFEDEALISDDVRELLSSDSHQKRIMKRILNSKNSTASIKFKGELFKFTW